MTNQRQNAIRDAAHAAASNAGACVLKSEAMTLTDGTVRVSLEWRKRYQGRNEDPLIVLVGISEGCTEARIKAACEVRRLLA